MTAPVIDPAVARSFCPAFGLSPDIANVVDRDTTRWQRFALQASPPADLAHLHHPYRFARLWERLLAVVRDPTREHRVGGIRYIEVAGSAVIAIDPDGTLHPHVWQVGAAGRPTLEPMDEWKVALQGMPYRDGWLQLLSRQAAVEVEADGRNLRGAYATTDQACAYAQWAFGCFERQLRRHADLRQMRRRVAMALGVDGVAIKLAGRIPRTTAPSDVVLVGAYNCVIRHRADFDSLQREAPQLLPAFGALCEEPGFEAHGEPVARLMRFLLEVAELSPRGWRVLTRIGGRFFQPLAEFYCGDVADAVTEHLLLIDVLGMTARTPRWLLRAALACWGDRGNRWSSYRMDFFQQWRLWLQVFDAVSRTNRAQHGLMQEFDLVQRWITKGQPGVVLDKPQRAAGWRWLVRQAQAWAERRERELQGERGWSTPMRKQALGPWALTPLRNPVQLWEEARAMRHCADIFEPQCRSGKTVIISVRQDERRIATAQLLGGAGHWYLKQVKGFANCEPPQRLTEALHVWVRDINAASSGLEVCDGGGGSSTGHDEDVDDPDVDADVVLIDAVVASIRDGSACADDGELESTLSAWLERRNDAGDLDYKFGGRIVMTRQFDNWQADPLTWLARAAEAGVIGEARWVQYQADSDPVEAMTVEERDAMREFFVREILDADEPDGDIYGVWGAEQLVASDGRCAWAVYRITGYSFTSVELSLLGVCALSEEIANLLKGFGRFAGTLPGPGSDCPCNQTRH